MATDRSRRRLLAALPLVAMATRLRAGDDAAPALLTCWADDPKRPRRFHAGRPDRPDTALALPARGHDVLWHPSGDGSAVVVARRPGRFLMRWQVATGETLARFDTDDAGDDIRLEGHLCASADGQRLFVTESELIAGLGRLGVYDAATLERLTAWPCGGIGPHAVKRLGDGWVAVANGGVLTLPETGRLKRNLDRMDPSLTLIDDTDGRIIAQLRLPDPWMSIRHIAEGADGRLAVALQNEGGPSRPLLALAERGGPLRYADANAEQQARCGGYAGDVLALPGGFAVSCTTAGTTAIWAADGRFLAAHATPRVCALTRAGDRWMATGDGGDVWLGGADLMAAPRHWRRTEALDNHAVPA
ncbi:MAG: DUF1513 domain-containing protein [Rhodocyclaceae bacterium]|nr:DUF1513 domain-containing protein [Rhodocyclaceae bacterium]